MNIDGTITPEQIDELDAVRNELFYLYLDLVDARAELTYKQQVERTGCLYNRTALLYTAISRRPVALIDKTDQGVVRQEQTWTDRTGTYCKVCCADIDTAHYSHCTFRQ